MTDQPSPPNSPLACLESLATQLIRATEANDLVALERALAAGADPNVSVQLTLKDPTTHRTVWVEERGPLIQALRRDPSETLAHRLLDAGADPNRPDSSGQPPVTVAIAEQRWSVVERLINERRVTRIEDVQAIQEAAIVQGRVALVRYCLDRPYWSEAPFPEAQRLRPACTAASTPVHRILATWQHQGAEASRVAALRTTLDLLLKHQPELIATLNQPATSFENQTPLVQAVRIGNLPLLNRLIDLGADPNASFQHNVGVQIQAVLGHPWSDPGWTPLHLAASLDQVDVLQALLARGSQETLRTVYAITPDEVHRRYRAGNNVVDELEAMRPGVGLTPLEVAQQDRAVRCQAFLEQRALRTTIGPISTAVERSRL